MADGYVAEARSWLNSLRGSQSEVKSWSPCEKQRHRKQEIRNDINFLPWGSFLPSDICQEVLLSSL